MREKYPDRDIILIEGSYIGRDFGFRQYDTAISFETMHHMTHGEKVSVYEAVWNALTPKGLYIECDYMVLTQAEEDALYAKTQGSVQNRIFRMVNFITLTPHVRWRISLCF